MQLILDMDNILISILSGAGGGGLIYILTKTYFVEKIKGQIKIKYDSQLEYIKGEINQNHGILTNVLNSQSQIFQAGQTERIDAIKKLWINYLECRDILKDIMIVDSALLETEFNSLYTDKWKGNSLFPNMLENHPSLQCIETLNKLTKETQELRPFLGEELWLMFSFLNTFNGRICFIYREGTKSKKMSHWKNDLFLVKLSENVLTKEEADFIRRSTTGSIKAIHGFIDQKVLSQISTIMTGSEAATNTYNQAIKLGEITQEVDRSKTN